MKQQKAILIAVLLVSMLLFAACGSTGSQGDVSAQATNETSQGDTAGQPSQDTAATTGNQNAADSLGINGVITEITDNVITIAQNPTGSPGNGGGKNGVVPKASEGDVSDSTSGGTPPSQGSEPSGQEPPVLQPGEGDATANNHGGDLDTSTWEKVTYTINDDTKIVKQTAGDGAAATETSIDISELTTGTMVTITPDSSDATIASKIVVMEGKGMPPQQPTS